MTESEANAAFEGNDFSGEVKPGSTGLVLEGGGLRGIYTAGVLDVLGENGVSFDGVVGVSAGAVHAVSFLAHQYGRNLRFYLAYSPSVKFMGVRSWLKTGDFINYQFCYEEIPQHLVPFDFDALEASQVPLYLVCTDVETGKPYYHRTRTIRGDQMQALRATASLPIVSRIVEFNDHKLLDGGTSDSIPVSFLRSLGYTRTVVVVTQVAGYRKKREMPPFFKWMYRKYPAYVECMETRYKRYNETLDLIESLEESGEIFVFRPSRKVHIGRLERDTTRILEMYELGRKDARDRLEALKSFLGT